MARAVLVFASDELDSCMLTTAMSNGQVLRTALAAHLSEAAVQELAAAPGLELRLLEWIRSAREAWPGVAVSDEAILSYVASRLDQGRPLVDALEATQWTELYLACGCGEGDTAALQAFDEQYISHARQAVAHMKLSQADVEEVLQGIREKLFVAAPGAQPRINDYAGGGSLHGLVKVMAVRAAISLTRRHKREHPEPDDELLRLPSLETDPELASVKQELREHFRHAFEHAAAQLSSRQRNLLRLHLLDGVTLAQLATTYSVHRATVIRWLTQARQSLLTNTRKRLQDEVSATNADLDSFVGLVQSRLDISLRRVLKTHLE